MSLRAASSRKTNDSDGSRWWYHLPSGAESIVKQICAERVLVDLLNDHLAASTTPFKKISPKSMKSFQSVSKLLYTYPGLCHSIYTFHWENGGERNLSVLSMLCCIRAPLELIQHVHSCNPRAIQVAEPQKGCLPFHYACTFQASLAVIEFLLQQYPQAIQVPRADGMLALHLAVYFQAPERIVQWLVQAWPGALSVACEYEQWTVLHAAARGQATMEVVQYLVSRGADTGALDERGRTPLHLACRKRGNGSVVEYLLRHAAPTLLSEDVVGLTPLFYAARHQSTTMLQTLLQEAPTDVELPQNPFLVDQSGTSLLHYAALDNTPAEITYLAQRFPQMLTLRMREDSGYTPLHLACHFGAPLANIETLVKLLEQLWQDRSTRCRAQAAWRDLRGYTPLQIAKACPTMDPAVLEFLSNHPMPRVGRGCEEVDS